METFNSAGKSVSAPNKGTTILYWFRLLSTVLSHTENSRIEGFFEAFEWFSSTFQGKFNFRDFSRKPSKFKYFSSLWKPCICSSWGFGPYRLRVVYFLVPSADQAWQNVGLDLDPNYWYSDGIPESFFQKNWYWIKSADDKKQENYPGCKELNTHAQLSSVWFW